MSCSTVRQRPCRIIHGCPSRFHRFLLDVPSSPLLKRSRNRQHQGSAVLWLLLWISSTAMIGLAAVNWAAPAFESRLRTAVEQEVGQLSGLDPKASVNVEGRAVTLRGEVANESQLRDIVTAAAAISPFTAIDNRLTLTQHGATAPAEATRDAASRNSSFALSTSGADQAAERSPARLSFEVDGGILKLSGEMPSEAPLDAFIDTALALFELDYVHNELHVAEDVAAAPWFDSLEAMLPIVAGLDSPAISINGRQVTVRGSTDSSQKEKRVVGKLLGHIGRMSLIEKINVIETIPVPMREAGMPVTAAATLAVDAEPETDPISAVTMTATSATIGDLARKSNEKTIDPSRPALSRASLALLNELDKRPVADIGFDRELEAVSDDSLPIIDDVAALLLAHPDIEVSVDGHYRDAARAGENLALSQAWSSSVRERLVRQGVSVYRLRARGFGEGVPLPEGKPGSGNRIEFTISD
ncbi:MAG: hypothetical protein CSA54_02885 [Gammaproteobacteria bacterium]|nr:MAG: hypothetical protein CSA54_02885 [Gammaproteobacteria bacterium]